MLRTALPHDDHAATALAVLVVAIAASNWVQYARSVRGSTMVEKTREYVQAARVIGIAPLAIMRRHLLPNVLGPVLVLATINIATAIITEATLSFLGVGLPVTEPSLGTLIRIGNDFLFSGEWWITIFPGAALVIIVLSINLVGTWLDSLTTNESNFSAAIECKGVYGPTCGTPSPSWRHKMRVTWTSPWDFSLSLDWRHLGSVSVENDVSLQDASGNTVPDTADGHISAFDYFDLSANWTLHTGIELRAGIDNIFDKSPPVLDSNTFPISGPPFGNGNTFPGVYDSLGRTLFIGVTAKY